VVDRYRFKDKKGERRINGGVGVVMRGTTFKLIIRGRGEREKNIALNVPIQCSLVLLKKARWEQGNALGSKDGSVLGADSRKCAAEEIS
jgi:hypothetical protein